MKKFNGFVCIVFAIIVIFSGCSMSDSESIVRSGIWLDTFEQKLIEEVYSADNYEGGFELKTSRNDIGYDFYAELPLDIPIMGGADYEYVVVKGKTDKKKNITDIGIELVGIDTQYFEKNYDDLTADSIYNIPMKNLLLWKIDLVNFLSACGSAYSVCGEPASNIDAVDFVISTFNNEQIVGDWSFLLTIENGQLKFEALWLGENIAV